MGVEQSFVEKKQIYAKFRMYVCAQLRHDY